MARGKPTAWIPPAKPNGAAAKELDDFAPPRAKKPKGLNPVSKHAREVYEDEVEEMRASGEWSHFGNGHAVALWAMCHEKVYGVRPAEVDSGRDFAMARAHVARFAKAHLEGELRRLVDFIRWTWQREEQRERGRVARGEETHSRIGWRLQFSPILLTDYRMVTKQSR